MRLVALVLLGACGGASPPPPPASPSPSRSAWYVESPPMSDNVVTTVMPGRSPRRDDEYGAPGMQTVPRAAAPTRTVALLPPRSLAIVAPTGAPADAPLESFVLVWVDAWFYLGPSARAPKLRVATLPAREAALGHAFPARVISAGPELVEIGALKPYDAFDPVTHCGAFDRRYTADDGAMRVFVRRADIAPVISAVFQARYSDGTKIALTPGAPALALGDGRTLVRVGQTSVPIALPPSAVGYSYHRDKNMFAGDYSNTEDYDVVGRQATLNGTEVALDAGHVRINRIDPAANRMAVQLKDDCAAVTLLVDQDGVERSPYPRRFGTIGYEPPVRWFVTAGTKLTTRPGNVTVVARDDITLEAPARDATAVCVDVTPRLYSTEIPEPSLTPVPRAKMQLCAPRRSVRFERSRR